MHRTSPRRLATRHPCATSRRHAPRPLAAATRALCALLLALLALSAPPAAWAQDAAPPEPSTATPPTAPPATPPATTEEPSPLGSPRAHLPWDSTLDFTVTGVTIVSWALMETVLKEPLGPDTDCYWCTPPAFDESVRDALVWDDPHAGEVATLYSGIVLPPISAFGLTALAAGLDGRLDETLLNSLVITEAVGVTMVLTNAAKWTFGRRRPSVYNQTPRGEEFPPDDRNLSFFSGHSSLAWSLATSAGTVASMRGYRWAPLVWASGVSLAAFTAYGRIGADAHWFSDVLTGSLVGGGLGFAIPYFFHHPVEPEPSDVYDVAILPVIGAGHTGLAAVGHF